MGRKSQTRPGAIPHTGAEVVWAVGTGKDPKYREVIFSSLIPGHCPARFLVL